MKTLTVFTPAYNRAHTIVRTYESLVKQTSDDFEWLIIDDGSTDNTKELVEGWISEGKISIIYIHQENQGMHGAHNTAYRNIKTELNTCIDSDDFMPEDAVEKIVSFWHTHKNEKYAGLIGLDVMTDGVLIGSKFPDGMAETTLQGFYAGGGTGDKKLVYRTDVINSYPDYPLFDGERYVGLAYKNMLIDQDYTLLTLNEPLVVVDYQLDGSSYNMYRQYWRNPKGFSFYRKAEMQCAPTKKRQFMACIHYVASSIIAQNSKYLQESPKKLMTLLATPLGILWYLRIRYKVKQNAMMEFRGNSKR